MGSVKMINGRIRKNNRGALEGLPLYLIILVVITAVAIVAILAWMPQNVVLNQIVSEGPQSDNSILDTETGPITVTAYCTSGNPIEGVTILIEGPDNSVGTGVTDVNGEVSIDLDKPPELPPNTNTGTLDITATYEGITKIGTIVVKNA